MGYLTLFYAMKSSENPLVAILVDDFYAKVADRSDKNTATRIVSPSVEFYASGSDVPVGFDDFFEYVSMFQRALAFKHVILETLVDNKTVLIYWRVEGTHKKELLGCFPTNKAIVYTGMSLFYFDDENLISKVITCFDEKTFIEQLRAGSQPE